MSILVLFLAYLLGSIPFGYLFGRYLGNTDIRQHGSGNIGATNVLRVMGWKAALPVFILDLLKGFLAVIIAKALIDSPLLYLAAGMMALIGHSFPVFLKFRGGKAAATAIGVLLAISGWVTLALFFAAALVLILTRIVSLASMVGSLLVPLFFWIFGYGPPYIIFGFAIAALVIARHHANIKRLLNGTEPKFKLRAGN
jgi:acyl phosphate:glycerol-3-phosphate acyltransferase